MDWDSTVNRVLGTTELLALILSAPNLDMQTLLVSCSRVSRRWKAVIDQSPNIQKKLFLLPDWESWPERNPILWKHFPFAFPTFERVGRGELTTKTLCYDMHQEIPGSSRHQNAAVIFKTMDENKEALGCENASWRRMLLHQPPYLGVGYLCTGMTSNGIEAFSRTIVPVAGPPLRMERLLEEVLSSVPPKASERLSSVGRSLRVVWNYPSERYDYGSYSTDIFYNVRQVFDEQMDTHGIIVHHDMDPSHGDKTKLNANMAMLHDILKNGRNSNGKRANDETTDENQLLRRSRRLREKSVPEKPSHAFTFTM